MRLLSLIVTVSLTLAVAYYIYTPLPDAIQQPWKMMMLDAYFRTVIHVVRERMFSLGGKCDAREVAIGLHQKETNEHDHIVQNLCFSMCNVFW